MTRASAPRRLVGILTATVNPHPNVPLVALSDAAMRASQYADRLKFYADLGHFDELIFAENSGFLLTEASRNFQNDHPGVRFLAASSPSDLMHRGKGACELDLIQQGIKAIGKATANDLIVKISGRYKVKNIGDYLTYCKNSEASVICTLERNSTYSDTRLVSFKRDFLEDYVAPLSTKIDDSSGYYLEHAFAQAAHRLMGDGDYSWEMPKIKAIYQGYSGTSGKPVSRNQLRELISAILHSWRIRLADT